MNMKGKISFYEITADIGNRTINETIVIPNNSNIIDELEKRYNTTDIKLLYTYKCKLHDVLLRDLSVLDFMIFMSNFKEDEK